MRIAGDTVKNREAMGDQELRPPGGNEASCLGCQKGQAGEELDVGLR